MARPRLNDEVSPANILARMLPGTTYGASAIASKLHVPTEAIRPMLEQMVNDGALEISRERPAMKGFRRPNVAQAQTEPVEQALSVAGPPVHVRLDGTLTGYDAEFTRRVALCMMARPR